MDSTAVRPRRAFTLVELLVVIGIIALLIGILLPALRGARQQANTLRCRSDLRQVAIGVQLYVSENKGFFPGPNTSGLMLHQGKPFGGTAASPVQDWDWVSPTIGKLFKFAEVRKGMTASQIDLVRLQKYKDIMDLKLRCPENETRYGARFAGTALPGSGHPHIMSYSTPSFFHFMPTGEDTVKFKVEDAGATAFVKLPRSYVPKISNVGNASKKVFAFEGSRYWDAAIGKRWFDYSTSTSTPGLVGTPQGNFHSRGPLTTGGSGEPYLFDQIVPGNLGKSKPSAPYRQASLRHKGRMQVVFFDGHVEELTFLDAARPDYWAPKGSTLVASGMFLNQASGVKPYPDKFVLP